ncbi:MAG: T9SS type A sorting domain-containing protein [Balneola sp.]
MNKLLRNSISLLILGSIITPEYSSARQISIQDSHPIAIVKTIDSDEPERFANPSDPGIPAGDLNGDGVMDYVQVIEMNRDLRNPDAPREYLTLILTYNENGETIKAVSLNGRYLPLGDINNDGIIDVGKQSEDGTIEVVNFSDTPGEFFLETDRYTFTTNTEENPRIGESVYNDFNEDGIGDALLCENSNNFYNNCLLVLGVDDPNFQLSEIVATQFNFPANNINFSVPPRFYTGSSIAGTGSSIYAYGYTESFSSQNFYEFDLDENNELETVLEYDWVATSTQGLSDRRIYVADIDKDDEPEIISSDNRVFPLAGFVQIFFSDPVCDVREVDFTGGSPVIQNPTVINSNCVIDRLYQDGEDNYHAGFWREGNYASCPASDFQNGCSSAEFYNDDQTILPCTYESCKQPTQEPGVLLNGVADPSIRSRGIQRWLIGNAGILSPQALFLFPEILRIAEIYTAFTIALFGDQSPLNLIRTNFFTGNTQSDYTCRIDTPACELDEGPQYTLFVPIQEVNTETIRSTSSSIRESRYHHYTITVDQEETERANFYVSVENNFTETVKDLNYDELDKLKSKNRVLSVENDTLVPSGQFDLTALGSFESSPFNTFIIKNIGNIDGIEGEEILVGSNSKFDGAEIVNKAWIYLGANTTYQAPDLVIDFANDSTIDGSDFLSIGRIVEPLGDVNGDGFNDFGVGIPSYDQRFDGVSYGAVYVFAGGDFSPAKLADSISLSSPMLVLRPTAEVGYTIGSFGSNIAGGDFDGDGYNDIAVLADFGSSSPVSPTIRIYKGGEDMDAIPDYFLHVTKEQVGGASSDTLISFFDAIIEFMPKEVGSNHQDLYFTPGGFSAYPDAVIFTGGLDENLKQKGINSPATTPAFTLAEIGPTPTGSGVFLRSKPASGDFNGDGFYDIAVEKQFDLRDGAVSSRLLIFSPNSGIEVSNEEELIENPLDYRLSQNYPNPFNPSTNIEFRLGNSSQVTLKVFDLLGREVATLIDGELYNKGSHQARFDASALASGIYLYRLEAEGFVQTRKMMLIK